MVLGLIATEDFLSSSAGTPMEHSYIIPLVCVETCEYWVAGEYLNLNYTKLSIQIIVTYGSFFKERIPRQEGNRSWDLMINRHGILL